MFYYIQTKASITLIQSTDTRKKNNVIQSMSRRVNCIDNAPMESFFGHFKDEVDYRNCKSFEELVKKKQINICTITIT